MEKTPAQDAPSPRELRRRFAPTMVTHDLPGSLQTDILQIVVAAFLVLLQRTALLVAPAAVVALVRLPHCGKNESIGSDPRQPASAINKAHTSATNNSCDGKTPKKGYSSPRPFSQPYFPTAHASSHPLGALPHPFFTLTLYQQKEKEVALVAKQINRCREGENTNQLNHTPALPACHQVSWERNF